VREEDSLLILVPNQAYKVNPTGLAILSALLKGARVRHVLRHIGQDPERLQQIHDFFCDIRAAACGCLREGQGRRSVEPVMFQRPFNVLPVLSEVALTYRCNLRCAFCYAACGRRGEGQAEMTTDEVRRVLGVIRNEAKVPSVSFTGGEPTLRPDLPELVRHARKLGLRVNLITNATLLDRRRVDLLARAGLHSAQVSLEGPTPEVHDGLTGSPGSFHLTLAGLRRLRKAGVRIHTNTTLSQPNIPHIEALVRFIHGLGLERFSMNLVIPSGSAAARRDLWVSYLDIGAAVRRAKAVAAECGVEFMWYSPTPLCAFNPIAEGLGPKSCAACDGLLSVSPSGGVLPCSSFDEPVGNLLQTPFAEVWNSGRARFYRSKGYAHEVCRRCADFEACCGACPLYWNALGHGELLALREECHAAPV